MSVGNRPWLCYIAGGYYIIVLYNLRSLGVDNCKSILIIIYTIHDTKMIIKYFSLELSIFILFISLCVIRFQHYSRPFFCGAASRPAESGGQPLSIIIPMGGSGADFAEAGFRMPKPLVTGRFLQKGGCFH